MIIGVQNRGKMKTYNEEYVATQFFILGLPLVPIKSYFQLKSGKIIELGINWKSVLKEYLSWIFFTPGLIIIIVMSINSNLFPFDYPDWAVSMIGLAFVAISIYFFFVFQKSTIDENELRSLMKKSIGLGIHPSYFSYDKASDFQRQLKYQLKNNFGIDNWRDLTKDFHYSVETLPLIFAISAFDDRLINKDSSAQTFNRVKSDYSKSLI